MIASTRTRDKIQPSKIKFWLRCFFFNPSLFLLFCREKVKNRVTKAKKVRVPILRAAESPGVDAEFELSFRDNKPNQLAALENQLSTGYLGNLKVLPSISASEWPLVKLNSLIKPRLIHC